VAAIAAFSRVSATLLVFHSPPLTRACNRYLSMAPSFITVAQKMPGATLQRAAVERRPTRPGIARARPA
jgi:hypothetical protein